MVNKILLVDDEIEITEINKRYLEQAGYDIDIANDGREALEKFKKNKYSLIITDIMMPNMDGYDLISEVQYLDAEQPFLFITAKTTAETYGLGKDYLAGANIAAFENVANAMIAQGLV